MYEHRLSVSQPRENRITPVSKHSQEKGHSVKDMQFSVLGWCSLKYHKPDSNHRKTNNKLVISTFKFGYPRLTLNEGPKVKSDHTRRFPAHDFLYVGLPFQTSKTNNKRVISTFMFGYVRLTLKKRPKVKSHNTKRFPAHDFLYVGLPFQTSRTNNK